MSEEVSPKKRGKQTSGDLVEILAKFPKRKDEGEDISKLFDDEIKLLSKEAKANMLKKYILEKKREISELEKTLKRASEEELPPPTKENIDIDVRVAAELAKLPEEERKKVIETYAMLKMADKGLSNNMVLPLLISFARENKGASQSDMYQWAKMHLDAVKMGVDLGKGGKAESGAETVKILLEAFREMLRSEREAREKELKLLEQKLENLRQPGLLDALLLNPEVRQVLKEIGFFQPPKPAGGDPRIQLEIEKLKMMHQKELKKMEMEFQLKLKELEMEMNKANMMLYGLRQIGGAAAAALGDTLMEEGETEQAYTENLVREKCPKCGGEIVFPADAKIVTCPHCGAKFKVTRHESEPKETK